MSFDVEARYQLLCRASHQAPEQSHAHQVLSGLLDELSTLALRDLPALARQGSPDHFADILRDMELEVERFREFCEFPALAQRVVVGIGGAFSAGKSTFINALLGRKLLVAQVDPTTSLPTYLLHGGTDQINALNLFRRRIQLSQEEFQSLTHEELERYGSQVGALLRSAFISDSQFAWQNLALLDTPGYSKPDSDDSSERTDEKVARAQLNSAQFLIWVMAIDNGTISEADLAFLKTVRKEIPRLIVLSRADKKTPDDVAEIAATVRRTLADRAMPVLDVIPVASTGRRSEFTVEPVHKWLALWNEAHRELAFAKNFKRLFTAYARYIEQRQRECHLRLNRLNRILAISDHNEISQDAGELQQATQTDLAQLAELAKNLHQLQRLFFKKLKEIGDHQGVGIPMPEPEEIDLLDLGAADLQDVLLGLLRELREQKGRPEQDHSRLWSSLMVPGVASNAAKILRRTADPEKLKALLR